MGPILQHLAKHVSDAREHVRSLPTLSDILKKDNIHLVEKDAMEVWDKGVFMNELHRQGILASANGKTATNGGLVAKEGLTTGSYKGTQMALTEIYSMIEESYATTSI
jgi:hypothetical protein